MTASVAKQAPARWRKRSATDPPESLLAKHRIVAIGIASSRRLETIAFQECDHWDALLGRDGFRIAAGMQRCHAGVDADAASPLRKPW